MYSVAVNTVAESSGDNNASEGNRLENENNADEVDRHEVRIWVNITLMCLS